MNNIVPMKPKTIKEGLAQLESKRIGEENAEIATFLGKFRAETDRRRAEEKKQPPKVSYADLARQNAALAQALEDYRFTRTAGWFLAGLATMALIFSIINF